MEAEMQEQQRIRTNFDMVANLFVGDVRGTESTLFARAPAFAVAPILDTTRAEPNSIAIQDAEDQFRVCVSQSLLEILLSASASALRDCPALFESRNMEIAQIDAQCQTLVFDMWVDYLLCHGLAHIDSGHLSFNERIREWPEIIYVPPSERNLDAYTYKRLEVAADSRAAQFALARFARHWLPLAQELYKQPSITTALSDFLNATILLYRHLGNLRAGTKIAAEVYPHPIDRAIIFLSCCEDYYGSVPSLPPLSKAEHEMLFSLRLAESYVDSLGANRLECLLATIDTTTLSASAAQLTKQLELRRLDD